MDDDLFQIYEHFYAGNYKSVIQYEMVDENISYLNREQLNEYKFYKYLSLIFTSEFEQIAEIKNDTSDLRFPGLALFCVIVLQKGEKRKLAISKIIEFIQLKNDNSTVGLIMLLLFSLVILYRSDCEKETICNVIEVLNDSSVSTMINTNCILQRILIIVNKLLFIESGSVVDSENGCVLDRIALIIHEYGMSMDGGSLSDTCINLSDIHHMAFSEDDQISGNSSTYLILMRSFLNLNRQTDDIYTEVLADWNNDIIPFLKTNSILNEKEIIVSLQKGDVSILNKILNEYMEIFRNRKYIDGYGVKLLFLHLLYHMSLKSSLLLNAILKESRLFSNEEWSDSIANSMASIDDMINTFNQE